MNLALGKTYHLMGQYAGSFHPGEDKDNFAYTVDFAQRNYLWSSSIGFERVAPHFEINQTGFLRKERNRGWQRVYMCFSYSPQWGNRQFFSGISTRLLQSLYTPKYFGSLRATYLFTRESFLRLFTQAGRERLLSTEVHENYLLSLLFGWEYSPKSHLFVAYNEAWRDAPVRTGFGRELQLENRVIVVKVIYLYNCGGCP